MSDKKVVDMNWLAEGREDDFKDYLDRAREDLPCAELSDDQLANYAFMHYDRDSNTEGLLLIAQHQGRGQEGFVPKIAFMTAVKERLRWLSRRVAVLEGRYPGVPSPMVPAPIFSSVEEAKAHLDKGHGYAHKPHDHHSSYYDTDEQDECFSVGGELTITDLKAILYIHEQGNGVSNRPVNTPNTPEIPEEMPSLVDDNGEVNQDWCTWYERLTGCDVAESYVKANTMIQQIKLNHGVETSAKEPVALSNHTELEMKAKEIYNSWSDQPGWKPWVEGGNSNKQMEARAEAIQYLESIQELKSIGGTQ